MGEPFLSFFVFFFKLPFRFCLSDNTPFCAEKTRHVSKGKHKFIACSVAWCSQSELSDRLCISVFNVRRGERYLRLPPPKLGTMQGKDVHPSCSSDSCLSLVGCLQPVVKQQPHHTQLWLFSFKSAMLLSCMSQLPSLTRIGGSAVANTVHPNRRGFYGIPWRVCVNRENLNLSHQWTLFFHGICVETRFFSFFFFPFL
jgi:hypothetical protein